MDRLRCRAFADSVVHSKLTNSEIGRIRDIPTTVSHYRKYHWHIIMINYVIIYYDMYINYVCMKHVSTNNFEQYIYITSHIHNYTHVAWCSDIIRIYPILSDITQVNHPWMVKFSTSSKWLSSWSSHVSIQRCAFHGTWCFAGLVCFDKTPTAGKKNLQTIHWLKINLSSPRKITGLLLTCLSVIYGDIQIQKDQKWPERTMASCAAW